MSATTANGVLGFVRRELYKEGAYLLPLRIFIGIGWLRAFAEKVINPGWYDGTAIGAFFEEQLAGGHVAFPFYRTLIEGVFLPNATALGWIVMVGQLLVGAAILAGFFTNAALLGAMLMNINFIMVGRPDPSAFYFVIEAALFLGGIGAILGVDAILSRRIKNPLLVAKNGQKSQYFRTRKRVLLGAAICSLAFAAYSFTNVSTYDPEKSVEDPAAVLTVLGVLGSVQALISYLRQRPPPEAPVLPSAENEVQQEAARQTCKAETGPCNQLPLTSRGSGNLPAQNACAASKEC